MTEKMCYLLFRISYILLHFKFYKVLFITKGRGESGIVKNGLLILELDHSLELFILKCLLKTWRDAHATVHTKQCSREPFAFLAVMARKKCLHQLKCQKLKFLKFNNGDQDKGQSDKLRVNEVHKR